MSSRSERAPFSLSPLGRDRPWTSQGPEHFLGSPANRALPIFRQVLKPGALWDFAFSISPVRIINVAAIDGLALPHVFRSCHQKFTPLLEKVERRVDLLFVDLQEKALDYIGSKGAKPCKHILGCATNGAYPTYRQFPKPRICWNPSHRITISRLI
jgi:hypothetical protein